MDVRNLIFCLYEHSFDDLNTFFVFSSAEESTLSKSRSSSVSSLDQVGHPIITKNIFFLTFCFFYKF